MLRLSLTLLLLPSLAFSQEVSPLRKRASSDDVNAAKAIVKQSESAPIVMPYGGYALVPMEIVADPFIVPGGDDCLNMQIIPKGKVYQGWMVSKNSPGTFQFITIPANDKSDVVLVSGINNGSKTIVWHAVVEGKSTIIDAKAFQVVGNQPTPAPSPVDPEPDAKEPLVKAAKSDISAGSGTADDVASYSNLFSMYATQVKNGSKLVTVGDLYTAMKASIETLLGEDTTKTLPQLRKAVAAEFSSKLPTNASTKLDDTLKASISAELLSVSKRLQGVK